ncbi:hypothetical protein GCM10023196_071580 [Actinoallomurus vinaceus]|uniref:Uncharacterized protein n=1 Tax=Actinoallomurus vinaceus TaxID=1080074 RepID=A0ABP8UMF7_9ACTN
MKLNTTLAVAGIAGAIAAAGLASPAQATASKPAKPHDCLAKRDHLAVSLGKSWPAGNTRVDQAVVIGSKATAKGKICLLTGRAKVKLLDKRGHVIRYGYITGARGRAAQVGAGHEAVFHLFFGTSKTPHVRPAKIRVTLPKGAGTYTVSWGKAPVPTSKIIKVDGIKPYLD